MYVYGCYAMCYLISRYLSLSIYGIECLPGGQRDGVSVCVWGDVCGDVCGGVVWGVDVDVGVCGCVLNYVMCHVCVPLWPF